jgi:hypothetical protein
MTSIGIEELFGDQIENLQMIKDYAGAQFLPPGVHYLPTGEPFTLESAFNGIGSLKPGQGYDVKGKVGNPEINLSFSNAIDIPGCTNPNALNYNSEATVDDGTCTIPGCTDPSAANYNVTATVDDGTCNYPPALSDSQFITMPPAIHSPGTNTFLISTNRDLPLGNALYDAPQNIETLFDTYLYEEGGTVPLTPSEVESLIVLIKDHTGTAPVYRPEYGFNAIGNMIPARSYLVSLNSNRQGGNPTTRYELRLPGAPFSSYTYELEAGWNYIGVPFDNVRTVESVFGAIAAAGKVIRMKNTIGQMWLPYEGYNAIVNMTPGEGYEIKVSEAISVPVNM